MKWVINLPVWGASYRQKFLKRGLPAIFAALKHAGVAYQDVRFLGHADDALALDSAFGLWKAYFLPVPHAVNSTCQLGNADRHAIHTAGIGEAIMFVNADMVVSREVFAACEKRFAEGKTFISCPAIRTVDIDPPIGEEASALLEWSWINRHQFTEDCVWGRGQVKAPPYVLFDDGENTVMHAFDLHPLAIYKTRDLEYSGPTASEIISLFGKDETHIVRTPNEMAIAEPSPSDLHYSRFKKMKFNRRAVIEWGKHFSIAMQHYQFRQQIVLRGSGKPDADVFAAFTLKIAAREIANGIAFDIHNQRTWPTKYELAMRVPYPIRQMIPKFLRQWVINSDLQ